MKTFEHSASYPLVRNFGEPAFDHVQPRTTRRYEVKMKSRVVCNPLTHRWMLVRSVVIKDQVEIETFGSFAIDFLQELKKLLVTMSFLNRCNDPSIDDRHGCEQRCGSVPDIVVTPTLRTAFPHRKQGLRAVQRLDLAFFVHGKDDCPVGGD